MIRETLLFWADGRLLPLSDKNQEEKYSPYHFYQSPEEMPLIRTLSRSEQHRIQEGIKRQESRKYPRHPAFLNSLWGMKDFQTAENTVQSIVFLGKDILVHPEIVEKLALVEKTIRKLASHDETVGIWLKSLSTIGAYVWRDVAGSANRSLHSYGLALDLIPEDYGGKQVYWRWSRFYNPEWWAIPYEERYFPPESVILAFEKQGFIWGGKWFFFDQIHFEYRPELLTSRDHLKKNLQD